jgi:hypothetical protein
MAMTGLQQGQNGTVHINKVIPTTGTPVNSVNAQGLLTIALQPVAGETFTIGTKVYTFVTDETAAEDGEVDVGADVADAKVQIVAAINGTDHNTASVDVTASTFAADICTLTAILGGVLANSTATTETLDGAGNIFDDTTLGTETPGVDGTPGVVNEALMDASYLYYCTAESDITQSSWVRTAVASF